MMSAMSKLLALLAVLLILSGVVLLAVPRESAAPSGPRSLSPTANAPAVTSTLSMVRSVAEQANAPLSILMGLVSLFYTRRTYINSKRLADGKPQS